MVNSKIIRNYIAFNTIEQLKLLYRQKLKPYTLVIILGDLVLYKDSIINLKTRLVQVNIKRRNIIVNFNILLLGQNKAVLGII
jgi:hypothetical protein